jgi:hypothetical protein
MKKLNYLLGLMLITGMIFTSCSIDDDDPLPPGIHFKGESGYTSADVTINENNTIKVGIVALSNSTSGKNITSFKLTLTSNNVPQVLIDSVVNTATYDADYFITFPDEGEYRLSAKVTDKDGQSAEVAFTVTVNGVAGIIDYTDKILGSYNSNTGSSFASADGTVYTLADAKANSEKIDWLYFYGATNHATIAAPDDDVAATVFTGADGLENWETRNNTRFAHSLLTADQFNEITTKSQLVTAAQGANPTETRLNSLQVGNVLAFLTAGGDYGLIRVDAIVEGADGTISISVKIPE